MGHPRRYSKKYEAPKKPWDKTRLESEKKIKEEFGLRRKHEIWRAEGIVRDFRRRARELQAKPDGTKEKDLLAKLNSLGIHCAKLGSAYFPPADAPVWGLEWRWRWRELQ